MPLDFVVVEQHEKGHGRGERRLTVSSLLAGYSDWPYLARAGLTNLAAFQRSMAAAIDRLLFQARLCQPCLRQAPSAGRQSERQPAET